MNYEYITNNPLVKKNIKDDVVFIKGSNYNVYMKVKNKIKNGYTLITHPLTGNIPPDVIPYKTVIVSIKKNNSVDSMEIIDKAILYLNNLSRDTVNTKWNNNILNDFQLLDYDYVKTALKNINQISS